MAAAGRLPALWWLLLGALGSYWRLAQGQESTCASKGEAGCAADEPEDVGMLQAVARHSLHKAGPGGACNSTQGQFCDYFGCELLCPEDNICPGSIGCAAGQMCPDCGQSNLTCPSSGTCPGKNPPSAALADAKAAERKQQLAGHAGA